MIPRTSARGDSLRERRASARPKAESTMHAAVPQARPAFDERKASIASSMRALSEAGVRSPGTASDLWRPAKNRLIGESFWRIGLLSEV